MRLIRDRELEIENFKPDEYWNIDALLNPQGEKGEFTARPFDAGAEVFVYDNFVGIEFDFYAVQQCLIAGDTR